MQQGLVLAALGLATLVPLGSVTAQCGGTGSAILEFEAVANNPIGPNTEMIVRLRGTPLEHFCVVCDTEAGSTIIPGIGSFCLPFSPNQAVIAGFFPASGQIETRLTVPPELLNQLICCQSVHVNLAGGPVSISNLVCLCFGAVCEGKVEGVAHTTTVDYQGSFPVTVTASARKKDANGEVLGRTTFSYDPANPPMFPISDDGKYTVDNIVQRPEGLVVLSRMDATSLSDRHLPSDTWFDVTIGSETNAFKVHTSCSRPIAPGFVFGPFLITDLLDTEKGNLCAGGAKPRAVTMRYTGEGCSATTHSQDPSKVNCSGDPLGEPRVRILATNDDDPTRRDRIWFEGMVDLDGTFVIDAGNQTRDHLDSETHVHIFTPGGTLLQSVEFHTSCSQPLKVDNQFGAVKLIAFTPE